MFRVRNKNIYLNRGDAITLCIVNNERQFYSGDVIKFSLCNQGDYTDVVFSKKFMITQTSNFAEIELSALETRIGDPIKDGIRIYWYEIELNNETVLVGYDDYGAKEFILYPAVDYDYKEYYLDTEEELNELKTDGCRPGSIAYIISGKKKMYMLNNKKEWVEQ